YARHAILLRTGDGRWLRQLVDARRRRDDPIGAVPPRRSRPDLAGSARFARPSGSILVYSTKPECPWAPRLSARPWKWLSTSSPFGRTSFAVHALCVP